jgi:hypothetical protein
MVCREGRSKKSKGKGEGKEVGKEQRERKAGTMDKKRSRTRAKLIPGTENHVLRSGGRKGSRRSIPYPEYRWYHHGHQDASYGWYRSYQGTPFPPLPVLPFFLPHPSVFPVLHFPPLATFLPPTSYLPPTSHLPPPTTSKSLDHTADRKTGKQKKSNYPRPLWESFFL